ncbi:CHASE domain-containing protein [Nisaea acidiphila]|uniref:CHASE domain-containing protein n=1 Tax=Nisaea acidiphila TaxID=1862145 RepID=A0A9J7ASE2_9PROT|nr:CHASE domain-containing protein [Nisaea acidiphila]UUX49786.1 CHASE domain-containing protein [Nisaea acidiphila]
MSGSTAPKIMFASVMRERLTRAPGLVAATAFLIVLAATFYAQLEIQAREDEQHAVQHRFARAHIGQSLQTYIDTRFLAVRGIVSQLTMIPGEIRRAEFVSLARRFHENFDGVQAVNWVDHGGVARWIVPLQGNEAVKDRNLGALDLPGRALNAARTDGLPHATAPIALLQKGGGFASYFPVEQDGKLLGFVKVVFCFDDLIGSVAGLARATWSLLRSITVTRSFLSRRMHHRSGWNRYSSTR